VRFLATTRFTTALFLLLTASAVQSAEDLDPNLDGGNRFVTVGQLASMRVGESNRLRHVLLDADGEIINRLRPVDGLDLAQFEGQEVGVTARVLVDGEVPILLAERISIFGEAAEPSIKDRVATGRGQVALASHEDNLFSSQRIVPIAQGQSLPPGSHIIQDGEVLEFGPPLMEENYLGPSGLLPGSCSNCGNADCGTCVSCPCGPPGRFWLRSEYLLWWTDGMNTPPLVTTSPAGTAKDAAGVLGRSGTGIVFGGSELFDESRSGARFRLGTWCDNCQWIGFETEYFFLSDEDSSYANCDIGQPILARPFFNTGSTAQDAELIQFPGAVVGKIKVDAESSFWSISPRMRVNLACEQVCDPRGVGGSYRFDLLVGYRYLRLDDSLRIRESLTSIDARNGAAPPTRDLFWNPANQSYVNLQESFDTSNDFNGADLGILWEGYRGPWSLELLGRLGIGNTKQEVSINGTTTSSGIDSTITEPGGLLALSSNIGDYSRNEFTVIPEFGATLGYALSPRSKFVVGYTFLYWNKVVRAGEQIDTNVNTDLIPPPIATVDPIAPNFAFNDGSFWAQGLSLGLDYRW
jgi:hypothetical protein